MEITTDGAGTVFGGQAPLDRLVVEIMDPGRKTIGSTSLAELGVQADAAIQEVHPAAHVTACALFPYLWQGSTVDTGVYIKWFAPQVGMDARSLAARLPSRRGDGAAGQSQPRKGQTDRGAKNAQQRRLRAFRQSLVRAVVPSHQAFLDTLCRQQQPQQQQMEAQPSSHSALNAIKQPPQLQASEGLQHGPKVSGELQQPNSPAGKQMLIRKSSLCNQLWLNR